MLKYCEIMLQDNPPIEKTFHWNDGRILGITGHSGVGKSQLLTHLAGFNLNPYSKAEVQWQKQTLCSIDAKINLPAHGRKITLVTQKQPLFPHYSVQQNLQFARKHCYQIMDEASYLSIIEAFHLRPLLNRKITSLSGGERNRVSVVQGLLAYPELLLLDEPFAALDKNYRHHCLKTLKEKSQQCGIATIMVSHSYSDLAAICDQILFIKPETIEGPFEDVSNQLNLQSMTEDAAPMTTYLDAEFSHFEKEDKIVCCRVDDQLFSISAAQEPDDTMKLAIPSHEVSLCLQPPKGSSIANCIAVTLMDYSQIEDGMQLTLKLQHQCLYAKITLKSFHQLNLKKEMPLYAQFKATSITLI